MLSSDRLFPNFFSDPNIIPLRLGAFGQDSLNKLVAYNNQNPNAKPSITGVTVQILIDVLTSPVGELLAQVSNVDTSLTKQLGATKTNDEVMGDFENTMKTQQGVIANAVGGFESAGYLRFYPHKLSEYTKAGKDDMPTLTKRVKEAATDYATQLGATLTARLQAFEADWQNSRDTQQQHIGAVGDNRTERSTAELDLQTALIVVMHSIGAMFPGDVEQCGAFFDFTLLYPQGHRGKTEKLTGNVPKNETVVVLNKTITDSMSLKGTNDSDNAVLLVFLAATANGQPNGKGVTINPGKSRNLKLSELGGGEGATFLIIKNLSDVNDAAYVLEVKE